MENVNCTSCGWSNESNNKYCSRCGHELPKPEPKAIPKPIHKTKRERKLNAKTALGMVFGFVLVGVIQHFFFKTPSYDKILMEVANELNKTCPVMVDGETRFDNAVTVPDNIFVYNYTLIHTDRAQVDTTKLKEYLETRITNYVKTEPKMKFMRDYKTTLNYNYHDKNGAYLFCISLPPEKYN